jgi:D-3-phosphoglycerate dehydrogenase
MKDGVRIINCARGGIVDEAALADAIRSGKVGGAAFDVFSKEPPEPDNPLLSLSENVVTPHLGASTEEAQINVAIDISEQIADVLQGKPARSAVNLPAVSADEMARVAPFLVLASKIGSLHTQLARDTSGVGRPIENIEVIFSGDFEGLPTESITRAALQGLLSPILAEPVNLVNAPVLAEQRGLHVKESHSRTSPEHTCLLSIRVQFPNGERTICGTLYGQEARIVHIDGYHVDIHPFGHMIVTQHHDQPGIIGNVGMLLGNRKINIAGMHVGRESTGGRAIMVLLVDEPISDEVMGLIRAFPGLETAQLVAL